MISGIQPGATGVGRLVEELRRQSKQRSAPVVRFGFGPYGGLKAISAVRRMRFKLIPRILATQRKIKIQFEQTITEATDAPDPLVLIHPQSIGLARTLQIIRKREKPPWLYLMDSSFFCLRSYNHVPGEKQACLRCLTGKWDNSAAFRCKPFPNQSIKRNLSFLRSLLDAARGGRLKILVQTEGQADLARTHFGRQTEVRVVGMWADFGELEDGLSTGHPHRSSQALFDIVFHGTELPAKGFLWSLELAKACRDLSFLFPFSKPLRHRLSNGLTNCVFFPMSWETGLSEQVCQARMALVPSLWSAPIEGALIKSIAYSPRTAVVREPSAFSSEIPEEIILKLSPDVEEAAGEIKKHQQENLSGHSHRRKQWIDRFKQSNADLLRRIMETVCGE